MIMMKSSRYCCHGYLNNFGSLKLLKGWINN